MVVKNTQIYGVQISGKWICKSKNWKVDISPTSKKNSDTSPYRGNTSPPRQRQITYSPVKGEDKKTYFEMYCFKSTF